jgi:hypothetical protein
MCEDFATNVRDKTTGFCITKTQRLTVLFSPWSFWPKGAWLSSPFTLFSLFPRLKIEPKDSYFDTLRRSRENRRSCWIPSQNKTSRMHLNMAEAVGMLFRRGKGTASRMPVSGSPKLVSDQDAEWVPKIMDDSLSLLCVCVCVCVCVWERERESERIHTNINHSIATCQSIHVELMKPAKLFSNLVI